MALERAPLKAEPMPDAIELTAELMALPKELKNPMMQVSLCLVDGWG